MKPSKTQPVPKQSRHMSDEADIGSGEKTPAQRDTEEIIRQIPPLPEQQRRGAPKHKPGA